MLDAGLLGESEKADTFMASCNYLLEIQRYLKVCIRKRKKERKGASTGAKRNSDLITRYWSKIRICISAHYSHFIDIDSGQWSVI